MVQPDESARRAPSSAPKRIAVYAGAGACYNCPQEIAEIARQLGPGYSIDLISAADVRADVLRHYHLYIQPGGNNTMDVKRAIGRTGERAIQEYVKNGGRYLGICLGATLASTGQDEDQRPFLGLLPVSSTETDTEGMSVRVGTVDIRINGYGVRNVFLQDPPYMRTLPGASGRVRVLATYPDGRAAAVSGVYSRGHVVLLGPHFEAAKDWLPARLQRSFTESQDVFLDFMKEALGHTVDITSPLINPGATK